ncbi:MAG: phage/plasmid primase, P4 family [Gammaproteobacteria bacterium]|nr:phage/plasmid primase, P4 family [Gammaproteobacteria bacterium]
MTTITSDPAADFATAMQAAGVTPPEHMTADGRLHRFRVPEDKNGSRNGWYILHGDGLPAGAFGSWKSGVEGKWCSKSDTQLSQTERDELRRRTERAKAERDKALEQERTEARQKAAAAWEAAQPAGTEHPYLKAKGVRPHGLRVRDDGALLVPLRDVAGTLHSLQAIHPDGNKRFLPGGAVGGHYHLIDKPDRVLYVAEGYATAATIHEATDKAVAVAFNAGNLRTVAETLRGAYPTITIVIVADNDAWTEGNPGATKAQDAAEATGARLVVPEFTDTTTRPTDMNDLATAEGIDAVRGQLERQGEIASSGNAPAAIDRDDESHPDLSHDELALLLGSIGGWNSRARYVASWDRWLFWSGSRWEVDDRLRHMTEARHFLRQVARDLEAWARRQAEKCHDATEAEKVERWARNEAKTLRQAGTRTSVESTARSNPELAASVEQWDGCLDLLGTPGGTVDLRTGELRPAARDDYITKHTRIEPVAGEPSLWLRFLATAMRGDSEMVAFLQRLAGYALTGYTTEHKLPFAFGSGGNGKSVFANTLHSILADYAARAPAEAFLSAKGERHPTDLAGLQGARLVVGSELPAGRAWNESVIKDLTGGDPITARFMRQDYFTYKPQFTILIVGNHQPSIGAVDEAMRRRLLLIPFTATIPASQRDPKLEAKLRDEHGAILQWMIEGAVEWYRHGLCVPASVIAATDDYLDAEDLLGQFMADEMRLDPQTDVPSSVVYERHRDWCRAHGTREWSQRALTQALRERGITIKKDREARKLQGWRVVTLVESTTSQRDWR